MVVYNGKCMCMEVGWLNHTLLSSKKDEPLKYSMEVKTVLTRNINSIIVDFNKESRNFSIKIGNEEVLMLPSEFRELINTLKDFYEIVERRYLK